MKKTLCKSGLSLFLVLLLVLSPLSLSARAASFTDSDYAAAVDTTANTYKDSYSGPSDSIFPWLIMTLGRSDAKFSTTYLASAATRTFYYDQLDVVEAGTSASGIAKAILALSAMGFDATALDTNGAGATIDAVGTLLHLEDGSFQSADNSEIYVNTLCYALLALDCGAYPDTAMSWDYALSQMVDTAVQNREHLKDAILDAQDSGGGWAWDGGSNVDTNTTAVAVTALAPYYSGDAGVEAAVNKALAWLKTQYLPAGFGYISDYGADASSTALVILALLSMGTDPCTYEYAVGSAADLMEALMAFRGDAGMIGADNNAFYNEQGARAVLAYREFLGLTTTAPVRYYIFGNYATDFNANLFILSDGTGGGSGETQVNSRSASVRIESGDATLLPKTSVTVTNQSPDLSPYGLTYDYLIPSAMHAMVSAMASRGLSVSSPDFMAAGGYITVIGGLAASDTAPRSYWSFYINNQAATLGAANYALVNGDSVVFYLASCDDNWSIINRYAYFIQESLSCLTGQNVSLTLLDETGNAVSGAELLVSTAGGSSAETATDIITDENGQASLSFSGAGTYLVSAQKIVDSVNTISRPYCRVSVSEPYVPSYINVTLSVTGVDSTLLSSRTVTVVEGTSAFTALRSALSSAGVDLEYTGSGSTAYVVSIGGLAAFDYGDNSGWLYFVNGVAPSVGCGAYTLSAGDTVEFRYTEDWQAGSSAAGGEEEETSIDADAVLSPFADGDSVSSWAREGMARAVSLEILRGDDTGAIRPQDAVTRGEFCAMLLRTLGWAVPDTYSPRFTDVTEQDWCWPWVQAAADMGVVTGTGGGAFRPGDPVTRQDMAVMLSRAFAVENGDASSVFSDRDEASAYALDAIEALASAGLMEGNGEKFLPLAPATREMAAVVLVRCLDRD